jgi:lysophospholipase L1-like esterase
VASKRQDGAIARALTSLALALGAAACGGSSPTGPSSPSSTPPPAAGAHSVTAVVYYDENGNGALDSGEVVRLPGVTIAVGQRTGVTEATTGRATVSGLAAGQQSLSIRSETLPPYFAAPPATTVSVPQAAGQEALLAATLPIGGNRPNYFMAFGDSITAGDGSSDGSGYRHFLAVDLTGYWGRAVVVNEGVSGTRSDRGADRMGESLARQRPAYSLILYGTNDYNRTECREQFPCFTIDALRSMIGQAKSTSSLPIVGTIPPANPSDWRIPPERNAWIVRMNDEIRPMVRQEGAVLADIHAAFSKAGNLPDLFSDHLHPNDRGYEIMAKEFFRAIVGQGPTPVSTTGLPGLFRAPGQGWAEPALGTTWGGSP